MQIFWRFFCKFAVMNVNEYKKSVESALKQDSLREALRQLAVMLPGDAAVLRRQVESIGEDYGRVIDFAMTGLPDPGRSEQLASLRQRVYTVLDLAIREYEIGERSTLYYNTVRTERLRPADTIARLWSEVHARAVESSAFATAALGKAEVRRRREAFEGAERRLFERIWTTAPLQDDDVNALREMLSADDVPHSVVAVALGALTLGALEFYNERGLLCLLEAAMPGGRDWLEMRATVGAVLVMSRWPMRSSSAPVNAHLAALREGGHWSGDVEEIILQLIRMADVEKISRAMSGEIIPEIMALKPDITQGGELNPEWEEKLQQSGLGDKLRRLSELQEGGGDMFYSVFAMLKTFPFFSHPSAWFLPFSTERTDVADAIGHDMVMAEMVGATPVMCDSDKYSFILSLDHLPTEHKNALTQRIESANIDLAELAQGEALPGQERRKALMVGYIQDLYRFFKLFRRKGEFVSPFDRLISPMDVPALADDFSSPDKVRLLGEFFFKHRHWQETIVLFDKLSPDASVMQKKGHAYSRLMRPDEAAQALAQADMLQPDSEWTLRHLAEELRACGRTRDALETYRRLDRICPDNQQTAIAMGECEMELGNCREALHYFYMAEFIDESSPLPLRHIAHAALLNGDFETSEKYFGRLMQTQTPEADDYLHMGHLALAMKQVREAVNYYKLARPNVEVLRSELMSSKPLLESLGIDITIIPLLCDSLS